MSKELKRWKATKGGTVVSLMVAIAAVVGLNVRGKKGSNKDETILSFGGYSLKKKEIVFDERQKNERISERRGDKICSLS